MLFLCSQWEGGCSSWLGAEGSWCLVLIPHSQWLLPLVFLAAGLWLPSLSPGMRNFKTTFPQGLSSHSLPCFPSLTLGVELSPGAVWKALGLLGAALELGKGSWARSQGCLPWNTWEPLEMRRGRRERAGGDGSSISLGSVGGKEKLEARCGWG